MRYNCGMASGRADAAISVIDRLLPVVGEAERHLKAARNWGYLDLMGGGFIVDMIKHSRLQKAAREMEEANALMDELSRALSGAASQIDYRMRIEGFDVFADFFFDGIFADAYMTSKIESSLASARELRQRLVALRQSLENEQYIPR